MTASRIRAVRLGLAALGLVAVGGCAGLSLETIDQRCANAGLAAGTPAHADCLAQLRTAQSRSIYDLAVRGSTTRY